MDIIAGSFVKWKHEYSSIVTLSAKSALNASLSWCEAPFSQSKSMPIFAAYPAFTTGDTEAITKYLNKQLVSTISFYDAKESFYHGFMLALLSTCANWRVSSNDEAGSGRADIIVEHTDGDFGFVVELKVVKDRKQLDEACQAAMQQIDDRDYTANLRLFGIEDIRAYAIAFCGKRCRIIGKKIEYTDEF